MPEIVSEFPQLEMVDSLIAGLEALLAESDEMPLNIKITDRPKRAVYRLLGNIVINDRKPKTAEAVHLDGTCLVLHCSKTEAVKAMQLEAAIQAEKGGRGETTAIVTGKVLGIKRVRGGYDIEIDIKDTRKTRVSPEQKLHECVSRNDAAGWNRWRQDISDNLELTGATLKGVDLSGFDLSCTDFAGSTLVGANLSGAILAGADLTHCLLDDAVVSGADFFRAKMTRAQAPLLAQSGMLEVESVIFDS